METSQPAFLPPSSAASPPPGAPARAQSAPRTCQLVRDRVSVIPVPGNHFKGVPEPVTVYEAVRVLD